MVGDWSICSSCPSGHRTRLVKCVKPTGFGEGETVFVSEAECDASKPPYREKCSCAPSKERR